MFQTTQTNCACLEVKGDHPIFRRPDKRFIGPLADIETAAQEYKRELLDIGYENVIIENIKENRNESIGG